MRSTKDLIAELEEEAKQHFTCQLVIAFANTSILLRADDPDRLQMLNDAIQEGGIPIGLIAADKDESSLTVKTRAYAEHTGEAAERAALCLDELAEGVKRSLESRD
jgi:hypothetical protein